MRRHGHHRAGNGVVDVAVVLAAGRSQRLSEVTGGRSKATLTFGGASLVERAVHTLRRAGVARVVVVVGFDAADVAARLSGTDAEIVLADDWIQGNGASMAAAEAAVGPADRFALMCGDHTFSDGALDAILRSPDPAVLVDPSPGPAVWDEGTRVGIEEGRAIRFGKTLDETAVDCGVFILPTTVFAAQRTAAGEGDHSLSGAVNRLVATRPMRAIPLPKGAWWQDIDTPEDLLAGRAFLRRSLGKESDGEVSRRINRPISTRLTLGLAPLNVSPGLLSLVALVVGIWAAWSLSAGRAVLGALLVQSASILDGCDGETARLRGTSSPRGAIIDSLFDRMVDAAVVAGLALWAIGDPSRGLRLAVILMAMAAWGIIAMSLQKPVAAFEVARSDEPRLIAALGGRDARMLLLAAGAVIGLPLVAIGAGLFSYSSAALWRVSFVRRRSAASGSHPRRPGSGARPVVAAATPVRSTGEGPKAAAHRGFRWARALLFGGVVIGSFLVVLPRVVDLREVWGLIEALPNDARLLLIALAVWNLITYWPVLMASMPGLTFRQAAMVCQSSTTVAMTVPAGGALAVGVSYSMFTSWGFGPTAIAGSALGTFVVGMAIKLLLPTVALLALVVEGQQVDGWLSAAFTGAVVMGAGFVLLGLMLRGDRSARWLGRAAGRLVDPIRRRLGRPVLEGLDERAAAFRVQLVGLLKDRWAVLSLAGLVSQLSVFAVMLVAMHLMGISEDEISWASALAVFASVRLATSVPIVPGNIGFAELGYIGGLMWVGGSSAEVVAAVLLFRFLTYFVQIPIGAVTWASWRRGEARRRIGAVAGRPPGRSLPEARSLGRRRARAATGNGEPRPGG